MLPLRPRLSSQASVDLAALRRMVRRPRPGAPDIRFISSGVRPSAGVLYGLLHSRGPDLPLADRNWLNFAPRKVQVFFWIARHGNTRTCAFLHRLGCLDSSACPFCPSAREDLPHLFFDCERLSPLWRAVGVTSLPGAGSFDSLCSSVIDSLRLLPPMAAHTALLLLLWSIWKSRNRRVFDAAPHSDAALARLLRDLAALWCCRSSCAPASSALTSWCNGVCSGLVPSV